MNNDAKSKRLDKIELQLTPKQWAIRLADEMRRYGSQEDFLKAIGKATYRQSPFTMPFFAVAHQAKQRWPDDIRKEEKVNRKLRMEFQAHKMLIININSEIKIKPETNKLRVELLLSKLQTLILKDTLAYSGVVDKSSAGQTRLHLLSELEEWADDSAHLLMQTRPYKTAVQTIQENYFESHPILYKDNEIAFEKANRTIRDAVAQFNEYIKVRTELSNRESDHGQHKAAIANAMPFKLESGLIIDIEAVEKGAEILVDLIFQKWVKDSRFSANAEILRETGKHEGFIWEQFRKDMGLES